MSEATSSRLLVVRISGMLLLLSLTLDSPSPSLGNDPNDPNACSLVPHRIVVDYGTGSVTKL